MIIVKRAVAVVSILAFASGCARDLSSNVYTSESTLSLTMEGKIISARPIIIKESDELSRNSLGIISGGVVGAAAGSGVGSNSGQALAMAGGVIAGAAIGALVQSELGKQDGYEYIVKLDTSKLKHDYYEGSGAMRGAISSATTNGLVTIVQGNDVVLSEGDKVYAIFSDKRTRLLKQK